METCGSVHLRTSRQRVRTLLVELYVAVQINFLADSLAGTGIVSPRRSRDICAAERAKEKRTHRIIRFEFYVECSCGYKGPSENHACRKCGATISFPLGLTNLF